MGQRYLVEAELTVPSRYWAPSPEKRSRFQGSILRLSTVGEVKPEAIWESGETARVRFAVEAQTLADAIGTAEKMIKLRAQLDAEIAPPGELRVRVLTIERLDEPGG